VSIFVLSNHNASIAGLFAHQSSCKRGAALEEQADWSEIVENWYLQTSEADLLAVHYPATETQKRLRQQAVEWLVTRRTAEWVREQNLSRRVAPSSAAVLAQYHDAVLPFGYAGVNGKSARRKRAWCQQFRCQWGIGLRSLGVREHVPDEEIREKVRVVVAWKPLWLHSAAFCLIF
jgi:hypothetical protein